MVILNLVVLFFALVVAAGCVLLPGRADADARGQATGWVSGLATCAGILLLALSFRLLAAVLLPSGALLLASGVWTAAASRGRRLAVFLASLTLALPAVLVLDRALARPTTGRTWAELRESVAARVGRRWEDDRVTFLVWSGDPGGRQVDFVGRLAAEAVDFVVALGAGTEGAAPSPALRRRLDDARVWMFEPTADVVGVDVVDPSPALLFLALRGTPGGTFDTALAGLEGELAARRGGFRSCVVAVPFSLDGVGAASRSALERIVVEHRVDLVISPSDRYSVRAEGAIWLGCGVGSDGLDLARITATPVRVDVGRLVWRPDRGPFPPAGLACDRLDELLARAAGDLGASLALAWLAVATGMVFVGVVGAASRPTR